MATASTISLSANVPAIIRVAVLDQEASDKASALLNHNHSAHDILFDEIGRHNHIVHHTLAAFVLGADADTLQKQYEQNASYQRPPRPADENIIRSLRERDPTTFLTHMAKPENYSTFLAFFTRRFASASIPEVLNKYVFSDDNELAKTIFSRLFAGYYHPFIHLGYGVEFNQPAIVAEALAQACVHSTYMDAFFELAAAEAAKPLVEPDTMVNLLSKIRTDAKVSTAAHWDDTQKVRDGVLARAKDEMIAYVAQWRVSPPYSTQRLDEAAAEVINAAAYFTGAAQRPPRVVKMDFFYMHAVTSSVFLSVFLAQDWITSHMKAKLVEYKGRLDLALYASRRSPKLLLGEITNYPPTPTPPNNDSTKSLPLREWNDMFTAASQFMDDGHTAKFIRALANGERACAPFENSTPPSLNDMTNNESNNAYTFSGDKINYGHLNGQANGDRENPQDDDDARWKMKGDMWRRLAMMVLDSVQPEKGERWARSVGFDEAWKDYPFRNLEGL
ncbi:uncharacterized protein Z519_09421 [Cladophialophora bantiana CBS 173.52]|uniref:HypA-like protein n=1 Tax=Cladophialophora bantiana (strain ATCC 10958 / CBS 173.52 / CDC B-1940 / NIH 8579) TaxID=1442370 RepID=A0A0D2EIZ1_CLAB1|nr:uncharacterized protein Z519_09421 [Cladophialophora bantiana CBS 173.52]KIW89991.1 hypothetical protein Z519_09421 [Cladophialophora bantiana CBS 173.52]